MTINERIRELRKSLGLTQAEFSRRIGTVQGHLTGLENGKKTVTKKTVIVICATYGVSEKWLESGVGEMLVKSPDKQANRVIRFFNELNSEYQDYMLLQLQSILKVQEKQFSPHKASLLREAPK